MTPRIIITPGEPAGIGPDITIQALQQAYPAELVIAADPNLLRERAQLLNLPLNLISFDLMQPPSPQQPGDLKYISIPLKTPCTPGQLNVENAPYVVRCLEIAADFCLEKNAAAMVTGPIQKSLINEANIPFSGHTEFLAQYCGVEQALMLFMVEHLKVVLVTTHIPLAQVSSTITTQKLTSVLRLLHQELKHKLHLPHPKIYVCGLNPHAGESGHLGREEIEIIEPVIKTLRAEKMDLTGPLPADTIFTQKYLKEADVIVAMYHDQALPVVKHMSFGHAVNVTLGLPLLRTSVDHGTALTIAGTGQADARSLISTINTTLKLIQ